MIATTLPELFALLIFGHALGDYPLQGEFLARAKNRKNPLPGVPWYHGLGAHAIIQGGIVGILTGSLLLGLAETILHGWIDDLKSQGKISYNLDQFLHVLCKVMWVALVALGVAV